MPPQTLSVGTRLGPYEITGALGAGGMGEVYRARDTKLDRQVAIKILPDSFAHDPERLARFEREARTLAALNHPNIATIHGFEESRTTVPGQPAIHAIVMELVVGSTLANRIAQGPIPLGEALPVARQIAEALDVAHEKGVIHRDLKPANVLVTSDGVVKVLDFGLASVAPAAASDRDVSQSPTLTMGATQAGVILGTAGYMSPEQAAGKVADKRADIWSFGVIVYEMLTGRRLFDGETVSHTLADVLRREIAFEALPRSTPPPIRDLVRRCLDRNAKTRLRDIGEARVAIDSYLADPQASNRVAFRTEAGGWRRAAIAGWAVAAVAIAGAIALAIVHFREQPLSPRTISGYLRTKSSNDPQGRAAVASG